MEERTGKNAGAQGVGFKDEFHSRLKYTRRGLLGMANEGKDSNLSQFFITLGVTPELQSRNTLFGRVAGDTIYNVAKMGEAEVEGDRPLYPTRIESVEILVNPFKDMFRTERVATTAMEKAKPTVKVKKRKAGKQLLSFGADEEDGDSEPVIKKAKFDTRIAADIEEDTPASVPKKKSEKKVIKKPISIEASPEPEITTRSVGPPKPIREEVRPPSPSPEPQVEKVTSLLDKTNAQIAALKASMRRNVQVAPIQEKKKSALEALIPSTSIRGRKRTAGKATSTNDVQSLAILRAFQSKLDDAPAEKEVNTALATDEAAGATKSTAAEEDDEEAALCDLHFIADCQSCKAWDIHGEGDDPEDAEDDGSWMSHALTFKADKLGKDLSYRKKAEEELMVIDPREKARTLKEEKRVAREARNGGKTGREWDAVRNEKLARTSNLAGRGAR